MTDENASKNIALGLFLLIHHYLIYQKIVQAATIVLGSHNKPMTFYWLQAWFQSTTQLAPRHLD